MGTRLDMIGIFVNDIGKMVAFYRDVLMFEVEWDGNSAHAKIRNEGVRMSMYERARLPDLLGQEPTYPSGLNGTFELAIDMALFEDVDLAFKRVVELGATPVYAPRDEPWGMRSSMVADPEGNLIEIGSWGKGVA